MIKSNTAALSHIFQVAIGPEAGIATMKEDTKILALDKIHMIATIALWSVDKTAMGVRPAVMDKTAMGVRLVAMDKIAMGVRLARATTVLKVTVTSKAINAAMLTPPTALDRTMAVRLIKPEDTPVKTLEVVATVVVDHLEVMDMVLVDMVVVGVVEAVVVGAVEEAEVGAQTSRI